MKQKVFFLSLLLVLLSPLSSESGIHPGVTQFGLKTVGLYIEAYEDLRSDNFLMEVNLMKSDPVLSDPSFYRYEYCNFDIVTPPLTTPAYPLYGQDAGLLDVSLITELESFLGGMGWAVEDGPEFSGGTLQELISSADKDGLDAMLVVRYTPIKHFVPVSRYRRSSFGGASGIITGDIQMGLGYIAALELFDCESGTRLWYSAYHTAQHGGSSDKNFVENVAAAETYFVPLDLSAPREQAAWVTAELTENFDTVWSISEVDEEAARRFVELTMKEVAQPFPLASESGIRDNPPVKNSWLTHLLWTDFPSYTLYGTTFGIGYTFDSIGNYNIYYKNTVYDDTPVELAGTLENTMMHKITLPVYSLAFGNLSIDPVFSYGFTLPSQVDLAYMNITTDYENGYDYIPKTDVATVSFSSFSLDLAVKYYLRFSEETSFFIGGSGSISSWWEKLDGEVTDHDEFAEGYQSLYVNYEADLLLNASLMAGVRFESSRPFEIYAAFSPVGPGEAAMISAGMRWLPFTWGWSDLHQKYVQEKSLWEML